MHFKELNPRAVDHSNLEQEEGMLDKHKRLFFLYDQNEFTPVLPEGAIDMYRKGYSLDREDDRFNILCHSKGNKDLPPA
jgi:hypothetical protein